MTTERFEERMGQIPEDLRGIESRLDAEGHRLRAGAPPGLEERTLARTLRVVTAYGRALPALDSGERSGLRVRRVSVFRRLALAASIVLAAGAGVIVMQSWRGSVAPTSLVIGTGGARTLDQEIDAFLSSTDLLVDSDVMLVDSAQQLDNDLAALERQALGFWSDSQGSDSNGGSL